MLFRSNFKLLCLFVEELSMKEGCILTFLIQEKIYVQPMKEKRKGRKKVDRRKKTESDLTFWRLAYLYLILKHPYHQLSFSFLS